MNQTPIETPQERLDRHNRERTAHEAEKHRREAAKAQDRAEKEAARLADFTSSQEVQLCQCEKCGKTFNGIVCRIGEQSIRQRVCTPCVERINAQNATEREAEQLAVRQDRWRDICPEDYQDSDPARITRELTAAKVECVYSFNAENPARQEKRSVRDIVTLVSQWTNPTRGLGLIGATGRGKTRLLMLVLEQFHMAGRSVAYVNAATLADTLSAYFSESAAAAERYITRLEKAKVLLLDDLGKGKLTERAEESLYRIAEARRAHRRQTFFTANCTGAELVKRMSPDRGAPIIRRLRDMTDTISFVEPTK